MPTALRARDHLINGTFHPCLKLNEPDHVRLLLQTFIFYISSNHSAGFWSPHFLPNHVILLFLCSLFCSSNIKGTGISCLGLCGVPFLDCLYFCFVDLTSVHWKPSSDAILSRQPYTSPSGNINCLSPQSRLLSVILFVCVLNSPKCFLRISGQHILLISMSLIPRSVLGNRDVFVDQRKAIILISLK